MRELLSRVKVALVGLPIVLICIYYGGFLLFFLLLPITLLTLYELFAILEKKGLKPYKEIGIVISILFLLNAQFDFPLATSLTITLLVLLSLIRPIFLREDFTSARGRSASTIFASLYVGWLISHIIGLRELPSGLFYTLLVILATWAFDVGGYFIGKAWGRRRLCPSISPGKSWEGFIGGATCAILLVYLIGSRISIPLYHIFGLGITIAIFGQLGDLAESSLKRQAQVKDSGTILRGHGGFLDRIDGLLFNVAVTYYYLELLVL